MGSLQGHAAKQDPPRSSDASENRFSVLCFCFYRGTISGSGFGGRDVMEADEIDLFAAAVPGNFQQVENAEKTGFARQLWRYVREADGLDRIHFDFAFFHAVMPACFYPRILPDTNAACDFSATNAVTETPGEHHGRKFTFGKGHFRHLARTLHSPNSMASLQW